jgi:hypothetical protein
MRTTEKRHILLDRDGVINRRLPSGNEHRGIKFEFLSRAPARPQGLCAGSDIFRWRLSEDLRAADGLGCPMILIRRTPFLEIRCAHEESPLIACILYEAAELILASRHTRSNEAAMAMH